MLRYVFVTRVLKNGPLLVRLIEGRIRELQNYFPEAKATILYSEGEPPECDPNIIEFRSLGRWPKVLWHFAYPVYLRNWARRQTPLKALILRRGVLPNALLGLALRKHQFKIFTEHHTKRLEEFALLSGLPNWAIRPLFSLDRLAVDSTLDGKICLTGEIAASERFSGETLVMANSIIGDLYSDRVQPVFDRNELRIAMPISADYPWQGVDRLVRSAVAWADSSKELRIKVTFFGVKGPTEHPHERVVIERAGKLSDSELRESFRTQHLGISTLGLGRKGMEEACPLKSRFFVSARIPFIYGYKDPDIPLNSPVALRVKNDESLIPWSSVRDFLSQISDSSHSSEWESLQRQMGVEEKTRVLAEFIETRR